MTTAVYGLLLAAGAGTRMGLPKALVRGWLPAAVDVLKDGGCERVLVVLGARADEARGLLPARDDEVDVVVAEDWAGGMARSLDAGLVALAGTDADLAVVHLVDLPDVTAAVVARVVAAADGRASLARAGYDGRPGHPVLLGRDHWIGVRSTLAGDQGARAYLDRHDAVHVECGDLATGRDVDAGGE